MDASTVRPAATRKTLVTTLVAVGGTTFGMQEETIAFYPILVPIFVAAGYDLIVPVAAVYGGSCVGLMGAVINPFSTIMASDAAGVNWTVGIYSRLAMLILGLVIIILFIIRYAERVKKDPTKSILYGKDIKNPFAGKKVEVSSESLSWRTRMLLILFGLTFVVMIYGVSSLGWWFEKMTALFLVAAVLLGSEEHTSVCHKNCRAAWRRARFCSGFYQWGQRPVGGCADHWYSAGHHHCDGRWPDIGYHTQRGIQFSRGALRHGLPAHINGGLLCTGLLHLLFLGLGRGEYAHYGGAGQCGRGAF